MSASHFINRWLLLDKDQQEYFFRCVEQFENSDYDFDTLIYILKNCDKDKDKLHKELDLFISNKFVYDRAMEFFRY